MVLIGMLDSPYVRRCSVSMKLMGVPHEHRKLSVFRNVPELSAINPVVKAPTFVCDDGTVLMDSTLILDYVEATLAPERRLMPPDLERRKEALRITGLALAAADKCVQLVYEKEQRPPEKMHRPWFNRAVAQANAGFTELERAAERASPWLQGERLTAADVASAVSWRFAQYRNPAEVPAARYPALVAYSARAEALPEFLSTPLD